MTSKMLASMLLFTVLVSDPTSAQKPLRSSRRHQGIDELDVSAEPLHLQSFSGALAMLNAIISDFQVNENAGPNGADQNAPSLSADGSGNFVMTWRDQRNGDDDIYAQRYSADTAAATTFAPLGRVYRLALVSNRKIHTAALLPTTVTYSSHHFADIHPITGFFKQRLIMAI